MPVAEVVAETAALTTFGADIASEWLNGGQFNFMTLGMDAAGVATGGLGLAFRLKPVAESWPKVAGIITDAGPGLDFAGGALSIGAAASTASEAIKENV